MSTPRPTTFEIVTAHDELARYPRSVFVATMGGFHEGHTSLIGHASRLARSQDPPLPVVVSVFVNPTQFDEASDYERYPRVLEDDARQSREHGATCVFAPDVETVYPTDTDINSPPPPGWLRGTGLEDEYRPGHLEGVWQVVHRLFCLIQPSIAIFGEKDWQQLQMITQLSDLMRSTGEADVRIEPGDTVREPDGLAMSSRNRFIPPELRPCASSLARAMRNAQAIDDPDEAAAAMRSLMQAAGVRVEYATVRDAHTFKPLPEGTRRNEPGLVARSFVAGRLGQTRILDNMPWSPTP
ncbi:MAG: 4-phosphopantoate--beta-alanine ligase [Planctomycetota bacterium]|jgi:pantoate--beta-alanine ligase